MADLTADKVRQRELPGLNDVGVAASTTLYEGQFIGDNASGYGRAFVAGDKPLGFAKDAVDNSAGAAGDLRVYMWYAGRVQLTVTGVALTDVGKIVYVTGDDTFSLTRPANPTAAVPPTAVGRVVRYVTTDTCIVEFDFAKGGLGSNIGAFIDWQTNGSNLGTPFSGSLSKMIKLQANTYNGTDLQNSFSLMADAINRIVEQLK